MSFQEFQKEFAKYEPLVVSVNSLFLDIEKLIVSKSGQSKPDRLFHYTSAIGLEGIVKTSSLWATDYRFLNDSKEMKDGLEILSNYLDENKKEIFSSFSNFLLTFGPMLDEVTTPHVVSFCVESDLLSQWRGYGSEAEGYCIEFDITDSRLSSCKESTVVIAYLLPVIYKDGDKKAIIEEIISRLEIILDEHGISPNEIQNLSEIQKGIITGVIYNVFTLPLLSFKNCGFSEEREWRAVFYLNSVELEKLVEFRSTSGAFVPYISAIFLQGDDGKLFQRSMLPIKSMCLPPGAGETSKKGLEMYLKKMGFDISSDGVEIKNSSIPLRSKKAIHW